MTRSAVVALVLLAASPFALAAQSADAIRDSAAVAEIRQLEQRVEAATARSTRADSMFLDSVYASDFRFKHGTGQLEDRAAVLARVRWNRFATRELDSLDVEVHGDLALSTGRIHVRLRPGGPPGQPPGYTIRYVRVYVRRNGRWRLVTHHTTGERPDVPG